MSSRWFASIRRDVPDLDLYDASSEGLDAAEALSRALRGEKAAMAHDKRVTNSEGGTYSRVLGAMAFASSAGFALVNPPSAFIGHSVCGSPEWINGLSNPVSESYHPNVTGQANFANLVQPALS